MLVPGSGFRVSGFGFWVLGFGLINRGEIFESNGSTNNQQPTTNFRFHFRLPASTRPVPEEEIVCHNNQKREYMIV